MQEIDDAYERGRQAGLDEGYRRAVHSPSASMYAACYIDNDGGIAPIDVPYPTREDALKSVDGWKLHEESGNRDPSRVVLGFQARADWKAAE